MFENPIVQARNDRANEIAEMGTMRGDQSIISHQSGMTLREKQIADHFGYAS